MPPTPNSSSPLNTTEKAKAAAADPAMWYWIIRCVIAGLIVVGNSLIIYLILTRRRLHNTTNWLTLSLAVADLLIGLAVTPSSVFCRFSSFKCDWNLISIMALVFLYASVGNLFVITLDRYVAVVIPLKYSVFKTARVRTRLILCAWIVPGGLSFVYLAWHNSTPEFRFSADKIYQTFQTIAFIFIPCLLMLLAYLHITRVIWRQGHTIGSYGNSQSHTGDLRKLKKSRREGTASLKVYGSILFFFVACWCLTGYRFICAYFNLGSVSTNLKYVSRLLMLFNSAVNPFIYALMKRDIRSELRALAGRAVENSVTDATTREGQGLPQKNTREHRSVVSDAL